MAFGSCGLWFTSETLPLFQLNNRGVADVQGT